MSAWRSVALAAAMAAGLLAATAPAAAAPLPFADGFESGSICAWSERDGTCRTPAEIEQALVGQEVPVCVPPQGGAVSGGAWELCPTSLCADGVTPGCTMTARVATALLDLPGSRLLLGLTVDDQALPLRVTLDFPPSTHDCLLNVTNGSGDSQVDLLLAPLCATAVDEIVGVPAATLASDVDLAASGCLVAPLVNATLQTLTPQLLAQLDALGGPAIRDAAEVALLGAWVCP